MSHIISKITFKVFAIVLATMLCLAAYFAWVMYNQTVAHAEQSELQKLKSIATTFAVQLEADPYFKNPVENVSSDPLAYRRLRSDIEKTLISTNRINDLQIGVSVVLVNSQTHTLDWIGSSPKEQSAFLHKKAVDLVRSSNSKAVSIEINSSEKGNNIVYAFPLSFSSGSNFKGYILAAEPITTQLAQATKRLYDQGIITFIAFCIIGFIGFRFLKRILRHEVLAKKNLKQYAELAEKRNEDLETLSNVLSKSDNLILLTNKTGKIEWINQIETRKNNYSEGELVHFIGKELAEVSQYPRIKDVIAEVVRTRKKIEYEAKSFDNEKNEFWASTTVTPILDTSGEVEKILFIDADITRLKKAEKEISQLANFTQENTLPVIRIQSDFTILYGNDSSQEILRQWNTAIGKKVNRKTVRLIIEKSVTSKKEQNLNIASGNRLYRLRIFPVVDKGYVNVYGEDITEMQRAENATRARTMKIEEHNLKITDSINYARNIQEAILPDQDHIRQFFKNSFALSKPKDIVSGDFFWLHELVPQEKYLIALADCTGHGVPGAMMSIVGHSLLNDIVEKEKTVSPADILHKLNREIIKSLRQKTQENTSDGMDVSILQIDLKSLEITFAGAFQPIYWMNGCLNVFKGDRQPIGGLHHDKNRHFTNHRFRVSKGDSLYLLSDGYVDQFGGPKNKKFLSHRLAELIEKSHKYSMQAQSHIYETTFEEWRGSNEQIDDVSLIGIKF